MGKVCKACFNVVILLLLKHTEAQLYEIYATKQPTVCSMDHNQVNGQTATIITAEELHSDYHKAPVYRLLQCCATGKMYYTISHLAN